MNTKNGKLSALCALALLLTLSTAPALAYDRYNNGGTGCVECHELFEGGPTRLLHAVHTSNFGITECNLCHSNGPGSTVYTYTSGVGGGLGCAGCHGRDYGETSPTSGQPKASGHGLRELHAREGVTVCATCHVAGGLGHGNPLPAILPENVAPPYYDMPHNNLRNTCDSSQEDSSFDADSVGLDNDGDGDADYPADSDCPTTTTTTTTTTTSTTTTTLPLVCGPAPTGGCVAAGKGGLLSKESSAGKEKLKVQFKKLADAVVQADFGDPISDGSNYTVCIYDDLDVLVAELALKPESDDCGSPPKPCWNTVSTKGYKFGDKDAASSGIAKAVFKGGDAGKGGVTIGGKNKASKGLTALPTDIASSLEGNTSATVQMLSNDAACFTMTLGRVKKAETDFFQASID